jgi:hypothetical protein
MQPADLTSRQRYLFWAIALFMALLKALDTRYLVGADGVSYIEMGDAYLRGDWKMAIVPYWSPLYSWLIVLPKHLFGLSLHQESTSVHLVNFLIFAFALFAFEFFLNGLIASLSSAAERERWTPLPPWALRLIAYALFLYSALNWLSTDTVTPDLGVEGFVFLSAGVLVRFRHKGATWANCAMFGVILAFGYLMKAVLFPLAFVFLFAALLAVRNARQSVLKLLFACFVFLLFSAPYILVLSRAQGRLTYGDTGKINYAMYVNGLPLSVHWQGEGHHNGFPLHTTRKVMDHPLMFEFAEPIGGSYPPWYNPSYWYAGVQPRFDVRSEFAKLHTHSHLFFDLFAAQGEFLAAFAALFLLAPRFKDFSQRWVQQAYLWLPALVAFLAYALIHVETRFLPGFLLLFWLSLFAALEIPEAAASIKVVWCVSIAVALAVGFGTLRDVTYQIGHVFTGSQLNTPWDVAENLRQLGVRPGDKVASIGFTFDCYWAHLAEVKIVAEIPEYEAGAFWVSDPETKSKVFQQFAKFGAKAVVCNRVQDFTAVPGWTRLGTTTFYTRPIMDIPQQ